MILCVYDMRTGVCVSGAFSLIFYCFYFILLFYYLPFCFLKREKKCDIGWVVMVGVGSGIR